MLRRSRSAVAAARQAATREHGFAVPTVLLMLLAVSSIVGVAVTSAVQAQRGTTRDADTKLSLLAAEAGASQALLHYNRVPTTPATPCVVSSGGTATLAATGANGWCPTSTGTVNSNVFNYEVLPGNGTIEVVSTGKADGVDRRIDVSASSSSDQQIFSEFNVQAQDSITLDSDASIYTSTATDGDISLLSNARVCGAASVGIGHDLTTSSNAGWYGSYAHPVCTTPMDPGDVPQEELTLPPVNQGDAPTNNDNDRFFSQDLISGNQSKVCFDGLKGDGSAGTCGSRVLDLSSNTAVTLGGSTYSLCRLVMSSNTNLFIAAGADVTIYFDSPEACELSASEPQIGLDSNARITATGGAASNIALLFVGSESIETTIQLNSNTQVAGACEQNFVIYAPLTHIEMDSNSVFCGALAGRTIHMDSNATVFTDSGASQFTLPNTPPHYVMDRFIECTSTPAADPPDGGC